MRAGRSRPQLPRRKPHGPQRVESPPSVPARPDTGSHPFDQSDKRLEIDQFVRPRYWPQLPPPNQPQRPRLGNWRPALLHMHAHPRLQPGPPTEGQNKQLNPKRKYNNEKDTQTQRDTRPGPASRIEHPPPSRSLVSRIHGTPDRGISTRKNRQRRIPSLRTAQEPQGSQRRVQRTDVPPGDRRNIVGQPLADPPRRLSRHGQTQRIAELHTHLGQPHPE